MSCFQAEQLTFAKEGVRPALKVSAFRNPRTLILLLQDRTQTLSNEPVQIFEHAPFGGVFEVFEPAHECRVDVPNRAVDSVSLFTIRFLAKSRLEFLKALRSGKTFPPSEVVPQKFKSVLLRVSHMSLLRMQSQFGLGRPVLHQSQRYGRVFDRSTQNHESSSPGESHPQALTEPDVNLSAHPALIVRSQDEFRVTTTQTGWVPAEPRGPASEPRCVDDYAGV
jgi:hypothetical protein